MKKVTFMMRHSAWVEDEDTAAPDLLREAILDAINENFDEVLDGPFVEKIEDLPRKSLDSRSKSAGI